MAKRLFPALLAILLLTLCGCVTDEPEEEGSKLKIGSIMPDFSVTLGDGTILDSRELAGDVSVIVFFNTACPDCKKELPVLQKIHEDMPDLRMVCIARQESVKTIVPYWTIHKLTLPYSAQEDRAIYSLFAHTVIPRVYIFDRNRRVTAMFADNPIATEAELTDAIAAARINESL